MEIYGGFLVQNIHFVVLVFVHQFCRNGINDLVHRTTWNRNNQGNISRHRVIGDIFDIHVLIENHFVSIQQQIGHATGQNNVKSVNQNFLGIFGYAKLEIGFFNTKCVKHRHQKSQKIHNRRGINKALNGHPTIINRNQQKQGGKSQTHFLDEIPKNGVHVNPQPGIKYFEISHAQSNEWNKPNIIFYDNVLLGQKVQNLVEKVKPYQKHRDNQEQGKQHRERQKP